ncbi:MAG: CPBP family intramembrane metalloprotease [Firmicutes bacterium]|nr:CPBP family intramembrane metalloprotease [Bacillota bacterium]
MNWIKSLFTCETALPWAMIGISCVICFWVDWKFGDSPDSGSSCGIESQRQNAHAINLGPILVWGMLVAIALATSSDPVGYYGLSTTRLSKIPWLAVACMVGTAFSAGRLLDHVLLPGVISRLVRENVIVPGGSFGLLSRLDTHYALFLGIFYIGCQTFFEELIFRGICFDIFYRLIMAARGFRPGSGIFDAVIIASLGQALLFGVLHHMPLRLALRKRGEKALLMEAYVMVMPTALGFFFEMLNRSIDSLWPGWVAHFSLNYLTMAWMVVEGWRQSTALKAGHKHEKGGRRILPISE